jgi:hypothetical protein
MQHGSMQKARSATMLGWRKPLNKKRKTKEKDIGNGEWAKGGGIEQHR